MSSPSKSKGSSKLSRKSYRQRKMEQEAQSGDKTFKEIKRQINKRSKKVREDDILEEMWVNIEIYFSAFFYNLYVQCDDICTNKTLFSEILNLMNKLQLPFSYFSPYPDTI